MMVVIISIATHEYYRMLQAGGMSPHFRTALCTNLAFILGFMACNYGMDTRFILSVVGLVGSCSSSSCSARTRNHLKT